MQVVLTQDYPQLGQKGIVVNVKPGFYRNFLMPNGVARQASKTDKESFEKMEQERMEKRAAMLATAKDLVGKLNGGKVELSANASENGSLYAQIHELDVVKEINKMFNCHVETGEIKFEKAIKKVGDYKFTVRLGSDLKAEMTLTVEADAK